jgi:hypothetical protein
LRHSRVLRTSARRLDDIVTRQSRSSGANTGLSTAVAPPAYGIELADCQVAVVPPLQRKCGAAAQSGADTARPQAAFDFSSIRILPERAVQRKRAECEDDLDGKRVPAKRDTPPRTALPIDVGLRAAGRPGAPLPAAVRAFFEPRFGVDFGSVRVHTGGEAADAARALEARAYTVGQNIVFAVGEYAPSTPPGRRLLAHELTHTIQQARASASGAPVTVTRPDAPAEIEADRAADTVAAGASPQVAAATGPVIARDEAEQSKMVLPPGSTPHGREPGPSTWGWGGLETKNLYQDCNITEMTRDDFVAFYQALPRPPMRRASKGTKAAFGVTAMDPFTQSVLPKIEAVPFDDNGKAAFKLKPTHAEMPGIRSAITAKGDFVEGTQRLMSASVCSVSKPYPIRTVIEEGGAAKLRAGEQEHCNDYRAAFDDTLALYASSINNVAAAERVYSTAKDAEDDGERGLGFPRGDMMNRYVAMLHKTEDRDKNDWHTATPPNTKRYVESPEDNGCGEFVLRYDEKALPDVGKHPWSELVNGPATPASPGAPSSPTASKKNP